MIATRATHTFTPTATRRLARAVVTLLTLTLTAACGGNTATEQNLATLAQGQWQTDARDGNICPLDTPFFRGGKCRADCKLGEKVHDGKCLTKKCKKGFLYKDYRCHKKKSMQIENEGKYGFERCYKNKQKDEGKYCRCPGGFHWEWGPGTSRFPRIYTGAFCWSYSGSLSENNPPKNSPLKANCPTSELALCGIGGYNHCTLRKNPTNGRELCVWNLPEFGYPACRVNTNNPSEALCTRTE